MANRRENKKIFYLLSKLFNNFARAFFVFTVLRKGLVLNGVKYDMDQRKTKACFVPNCILLY